MMDKVDRFNPLETSPKSPFQFHNAPYSASSCSFDMDYDEERSVTINSASKFSTPTPSSFVTLSLGDLTRHTLSHLRPAMRKAHELQAAMHQSHARIQGITNRVSLLGIAISPLVFQSSKAMRIEDHMEHATKPAKAALQVFHSMRKLHGILAIGPLQDVGSYVQAFFQFQLHMRFMRQCSPVAIEALGDAVAYLKGSRMVDRFHLEELLEVVQTLRSLLAGQEHLAMSRNVVEQALDHLILAFQRIIRNYLKPPRDLSQCLIDHSEGRQKTQLKQALPAPVLQILQAIAERLAFNNKLKDCLEIYQVERGYKLQESLQTLQSSSYLCHQTPDVINLVEWAHLEEHLARWTVHLDAFVSDLLAPEYAFCKQVFSQVSPDAARSHWKDGFGRMAMQVGLDSFIEFGEAFTKSQMEPQKLFKLLDMFDCLEKLNPKFEEMFDGRGWVCKEIQRRIGSLNRGVVEGVATVLKETKYRVEAQGGSFKNSDKGGAVLKPVSYTVNYLKYALSDWYKPLVCRALKAEHSLNKARHAVRNDTLETDAGDAEARTLVLEIMQALDRNLTTTAQRLLGVPAYASFFLMNNYSYIYTRCLKSDVGTLLGEDWLQKQLDKMELCAMQYKQEAWGQLIALVSCEGVSSGSSAGRELARQSVRAFQTSLDSLVTRHSGWFISNEDLRKRICHDVVQSVVPAYQSFLERYSQFLSANGQHVPQNSANSQSPSDQAMVLYNSQIAKSLARLDSFIIRYTPERVEHMLTSIFETQPRPLRRLLNIARNGNNTNTDSSTSISDNDSASHSRSDSYPSKYRMDVLNIRR